LNAADVQREWKVLTTLGTLALAILVFMALGHHEDIKSSTKVVDSKLYTAKSVEKLSKTKLVHKSGNSKKKRLNNIIKESSNKELALLEESLPHVLSSKSFAEKFSAEVKHHHRWLGVVFHFSDSFPRALRVLSLSVNIIVMLFVQSVTYNLTNPDDGTCSGFSSKESCLGPESPFGTGQSKCAWSSPYAEGTGGSCSFIEPSNDFTVVLFVAIFSAIVSTPIALTENWIIRRFLVPPIQSEPPEGSPSADTFSSYRNMFSLSMYFQKATLNADSAASVELNTLSTQLKRYRETLTSRQRTEFDRE
jgi:hypothetical protein